MRVEGLEAGLGMGLVGIVGVLVSIAFQVGIVALGVVIAWRWLHRPGGLAVSAAGTRGREKDAFDILDDRFARGDIDSTEYEERRNLLIRRNS